ncbi:plasmid partitioning protein RepB [Pseudogemmobacter bohemicus]|uniref:plasmid partitioning protein RepB n=1 Tax=Pseudogemmobacter bohemicus TaxID=2250708 RepID=UPI000DD3EB34|nr:plasmid partitioning protein RepB [Pseudogemmobacter bohemicus]
MSRKPKLGLPLQTLRNAPDALEGRRLRGGVQDIETDLIDTAGRLPDRLALEASGLAESIRASGQRVPILVRPISDGRYGLIYGRRRLEACRILGIRVRAIVTETDDRHALQDQLIENQDRRDLSFIERALVATALLDGDHFSDGERTNRAVAEILGLTEAGVSQLLSVARTVGEGLILAIGPAPGIGRPRWEELKKSLADSQADPAALIEVAERARSLDATAPDDRSDAAFSATLAAAKRLNAAPFGMNPYVPDGLLTIAGVGTARITTGQRGRRLRLDFDAEDKTFVAWLEARAPELIAELHERWRSED